MPGDNFARGSLASEPTIPAGSGGAGCAANGFALGTGAGVADGAGAGVAAGAGDGVADGAGEGAVVCACNVAIEHEDKTTKTASNLKVRTRFIVSPLQFSQH
jgi:hypothetical protein